MAWMPLSSATTGCRDKARELTWMPLSSATTGCRDEAPELAKNHWIKIAALNQFLALFNTFGKTIKTVMSIAKLVGRVIATLTP